MGIIDRAIAESVPVVPRPIVRRISRLYIAGDTLEEAVATVKDLDRQGCVATIDLLGESTGSKADAAATLREYKRVVDALDEHSLDSGISVKLTGLGLTLDKELCRANLEEIVVYAGERGRFVRVDMEDSPYTSVTLDMVMSLHERHENVGAVIQAYMRRSLGDVCRLIEAGSRCACARASTTSRERSPTRTSIPSARTTYSSWTSCSRAAPTLVSLPTTSS
jgi:proline dehydrogenase